MTENVSLIGYNKGAVMKWKIKKLLYRFVHYLLKGLVKIIKFPNQEILRGENSASKLYSVLKKHNIKNVLIVTDKPLMKLNLAKTLIESLKSNNIIFSTFDEVVPNPTISIIEKGYESFKKNNCEAVIGFGGGSPIDTAKIIAARAGNPNQSIREMRGLFKLKKPLVPLYAIPTTAGTGSETTIAAVVTDDETHEKFAVSDKKLLPKAAVLDPLLTIGLPPHITSTTGMDALTHAIEAYIGLHGTKFVNESAENASKIIFSKLEKVYKDGSSIEDREEMLLASFHAGAAFTRASVGYVHAIAHNMGGLYGVPHGLANAIILPYVLDFCKDKCTKKLVTLAKISGVAEENKSNTEISENFISHIRILNKNMNIPDKIKELKEEDFDIIADRALKEANPSYPVPKIMNKSECKGILKKLLI